MGIINIHKPFHIIGNRFKTSRYCENRFNAGSDGVEGKIEGNTYTRGAENIFQIMLSNQG